MGILAALLRRRPVRHAQHRAASAGAGACRRLVPRAHSAGRRAAVGARGRSAARHPPTRHAPRPAAVGVGALDAVDLLRARWPDHAAALREKLALTDDELRTGATRSRASLSTSILRPGSMSSSPASTRWNRSTSPLTLTAPFPSTW